MTLDELNGLMVLLACRNTGMLGRFSLAETFMDISCNSLYVSGF